MNEEKNEIGGMIISSLIIGILERIGISVILINLVHLGFSSYIDFIFVGLVFAVSELFSRLFESGVEKYVSARKPGVIAARLRIWISTFTYRMFAVILIMLIVSIIGYVFVDKIIGSLLFTIVMFFLLVSRNMLGWVFTRIGLSKVVLGASIMGVTISFVMILFSDPTIVNGIIILSGGYLASYLMLLIAGIVAGLISRKYMSKVELYDRCDLPCYVSSLKYLLVLLGLVDYFTAGLLLSLLVLFDGVQRIALTFHSRLSIYASIVHFVTIGYAVFLGVPYLILGIVLLVISLFGFGSQSPLRTLLAV